MAMQLSPEHLTRLDRDGFLILPSVFSETEISTIKNRLPALLQDSSEANIIEKESGQVRTAMGLHIRDEIFAKLVRHPRLVQPARQIRPEPLYSQQVKVNIKAAFSGKVWQWHYDFATHHSDDGVPQPLALNLHIFLDDVTPFNGPLYFIPGSHKYGTHRAFHDTQTTSYPLWVVDQDVVRDLVSRAEKVNPGRGIVPAIGPKGSMLIFHDTLVHGSPNNMSPWDRSIFSLILNPISNALTREDRPDYKHHRELSDIIEVEDNCLE